MYTYKYRLKNKITPMLDLRIYSEEIAEVIKAFGGTNIVVYRRSYSFDVRNSHLFTNNVKRKLGRRIAAIGGISDYATVYIYNYKNGTVGKSTQLFRRALQ
jgi:hypothetical protein